MKNYSSKDKTLSIVIPTVNYNDNIDKSIRSCLEHRDSFLFEIIISVNNYSLNDYKESEFYEHKNLRWECSGSATIPMEESVNRALSYARCEWMFILSDDDCITKNFLNNVSLKKLSPDSLYATRACIIDDHDLVLKESGKYRHALYTKEDALELFLDRKLHNHLSLLVFNKKLFIQAGKFRNQGYPNGYFIDTVFHGKIIATCQNLLTGEKVDVMRRQSSNQESAKFFIDGNVNKYFDIIVNNFFMSEIFRNYAIKRYKTKDLFYKNMIQQRFYTEMSKLNNKVYNKSKLMKIKLIYYCLFWWKTGLLFKFNIICKICRISFDKY
jgi:glycosyltransferase involved in cell wall biosynthesis